MAALKLPPKLKYKLKKKLVTLWMSCEMGHDGTWDCSTDEGKEAFLDMEDDIESIMKTLGIKVDTEEFRNSFDI